jgi:integrase
MMMGLPIVKQKEQRRPSLKAKAVDQLVQVSEGEEHALYVLEGATGMRISDALAPEAKHFVNEGRTIEVREQVDRDKPRIAPYLKTNASHRDVDLRKETARNSKRDSKRRNWWRRIQGARLWCS